MPDANTAPELIEFARRWADALRNTEARSIEAESLLHDLAQEIHGQREKLRRQADARLAAFYHSCPVSVVIVDDAGRVAAVNPAFLKLTGAGAEHDVIGAPAANLGATDRDQGILSHTIAQLSGRVDGRVQISSAKDQTRLVRPTATALPGDDNGYVLLMLEDVHELNLLRETFQHQGLHDPLTGLPNAAHLRSRLEAMLSGGEADQVALLFLDLDGFRVVSDGLGAEVADQVLRGVASTIRKTFDGRGAFVARLFGDGFAVAMRGDLPAATVVSLTEQVIEDLLKPQYVNDIGIGVSASVGIVLADVPGAVNTHLMQSAEIALHRAKELGKAQWVLFDPEVGKSDRGRYQLACAIAGALETGAISVVYQPHAVLPDAQIVTSLNAALRWEHPTRGTLRADEFYPLAEMTGMTVPLGSHLLSEALRTAADWRTRFGADTPMVCLTLPRRMAIDGDLVGMVRAELDRNGLQPQHLMLCTDGPSLLDSRGDLIESMGHLARLGVLFILNITGLPDLELIPALHVPAPGVMLTGRMVDELDVEHPPRWALRNVRQLVARAEELGVKVGAHGVKSQNHAQLLFDLGLVVASGPYLQEHHSRAEAEIWVGRIFRM